jgi:hypothetical protein
MSRARNSVAIFWVRHPFAVFCERVGSAFRHSIHRHADGAGGLLDLGFDFGLHHVLRITLERESKFPVGLAHFLNCFRWHRRPRLCGLSHDQLMKLIGVHLR